MVVATSFGGFSSASRQRAASHISAVESGPPDTARIRVDASARSANNCAASETAIGLSVPARTARSIVIAHQAGDPVNTNAAIDNVGRRLLGPPLSREDDAFG